MSAAVEDDGSHRNVKPDPEVAGVVTNDSLDDGPLEGALDGALDGAEDGALEGTAEGTAEGADDGALEGALDGAEDGALDGAVDQGDDEGSPRNVEPDPESEADRCLKNLVAYYDRFAPGTKTVDELTPLAGRCADTGYKWLDGAMKSKHQVSMTEFLAGDLGDETIGSDEPTPAPTPAPAPAPAAAKKTASLKEWLEDVECGALFDALFEEGAETPEDLFELDAADFTRLFAPLKNIPRTKLLKKMAAAAKLAGRGDAAAAAATAIPAPVDPKAQKIEITARLQEEQRLARETHNFKRLAQENLKRGTQMFKAQLEPVGYPRTRQELGESLISKIRAKAQMEAEAEEMTLFYAKRVMTDPHFREDHPDKIKARATIAAEIRRLKDGAAM